MHAKTFGSVWLLVTGIAAAHTLSLIEPRGGQRGTEMEMHFHGDHLAGVTEAVCYGPGLAISGLEVKDPKHAIAKLTIAADAALGEHSLRLRGPGGFTELRSFWVGQFPTVMEQEPNNTFDKPQAVPLNSTVQGVAGSEDEDYYLCTLKKGQRLAVEVEAMRLGRVMFDPYVAILDAKRFELAACDDAPLLRADACAAIIAPADGDYRIVVREAAYEGGENCQYRLHIGSFPRPTAVFPCGGKPGETLEFRFLGDPGGPIVQKLTLPAAPMARHPLFPVVDGLHPPSPVWAAVVALESAREAEPNGDAKTGTPLPALPAAAHGILDGTQNTDWFSFTARKDQTLVCRVIARALRSPLDSVLSLTDAAGKQLATNDDQNGPDSVITWTCPADGTYCLNLHDQLHRTGPCFSYRIEVVPRAPVLAAALPAADAQTPQKGKTFPVPRGNRYATVINITRENIACAAAFKATTLPAGVTLHAPLVNKAMNSFPIVLEAAADAPVAGGLHAFTLTSDGIDPPVTGALTDSIHHIEVPNQGIFHTVSLDRIATAVCAEAPVRLELDPPAVPLVPNGVAALKVRAIRSAGYTGKVVLRMVWNPPGVSGPGTLDLPGDKSEMLYEINTAPDAPSGEWPVCIVGEAETPQGSVQVATALVTLKVVEPMLSLALDLAAAEPGKPAAMIAKITPRQPFEGSARVELLGLPHGVTAAPQTLSKDTAEVTFPLVVAADAAVGKHTGVFCRVAVPQGGGVITHLTAQGGVLRVDAPPAPSAGKTPPAAAPPAAANAPAPKPVSRLEQLRKRAAEGK